MMQFNIEAFLQSGYLNPLSGSGVPLNGSNCLELRRCTLKVVIAKKSDQDNV